MAFPAGVIKRTVTFGPAFELEDGESVGMRVSFANTRPGLLWVATGQPGVSNPITRTSEDGLEGSVELPVTNQEGWGDGDGNLIVPGDDGHVFLYAVTVKYTQNGRDLPGGPRTKVVPIPAGDGPIDLDSLIPLTTPGGSVVSVPDTWSADIAAAVAAAESANEALVDSESFVRSTVAADVADPTDPLGVGAKIGHAVDPAATKVSRLLGTSRRKTAATTSATGLTVTIQTAATSPESDITNGVSNPALTSVRFTSCGIGEAQVPAGAAYKGRRARANGGGDVWGDDVQDTVVHDPDGVVELMLQVVYSGTQYLRLYADGDLVLDWKGTYAADQRWRVKLVMDSARSKTMHLRWVSSLGSITVRTGQRGLAWKPTHPIHRATALGIGDSFMAGAADNSYPKPFGGYFRRLAEQFLLDARRCAYSATGLSTAGPGGSGKSNYLDRVAEAKAVNGMCDFGILQLSTNDGGQSQASITSLGTTFVSNWRAQFTRPDGICPPIMVIGVARNIPTGPGTSDCDAIDNGFKAVINANPDLFPMPLISTAGWWTGNGYIGTAATSTPKGTTETGIAADGLHPSDVGHDYMADRLAPHLATFLALMPTPLA